jgi:hypothetical protein
LGPTRIAGGAAGSLFPSGTLEIDTIGFMVENHNYTLLSDRLYGLKREDRGCYGSWIKPASISNAPIVHYRVILFHLSKIASAPDKLGAFQYRDKTHISADTPDEL